MKIIAVFKTHFDFGFTALAREVLERYGNKMLGDVVDACVGTRKAEEGKQFVWTMSAWPLLTTLHADTSDAGLVEQAKVLISEGQLTWHALPFTTHTEFCGLEELVRGLLHSRSLSQEYGHWPVSAKMTDVPGHTWILPSILYNAGVRFLHLGCNPACTPPEVPRLFYWEGPDGSRILTFYSKGDYGSSLVPPEDWPYPVWLALMNTGDNHGPQSAEIVDSLQQQLNEEEVGAELIVGSLDDFYNQLVKHPLDIPVIRKDLADTWIHGVGSYPAEVGRLRALRPLLTALEKAVSVEAFLGGGNNARLKEYKQKLDFAFDSCLQFGEHTWGLDVKTTMGCNRHYPRKEFLKNKDTQLYKKMEESWDEQRERVRSAEEAVFSILPHALNHLAANIGMESDRILVFNPLGWERTAWVDVSQYSARLEGNCLLDAATGREVKTDCLAGKLKAHVEGLPALGYKALKLAKRAAASADNNSPRMNTLKASAEAGTLENSLYRIKVDRTRGCIASLKDRNTGKEWIDGSGQEGFGRYRYDVYGNGDINEFIRAYTYQFRDWIVNDLGRLAYPEQKHLTFLPEGFTVEKDEGTGHCSLILRAGITDRSEKEFGNAGALVTRITLYEDEPYIDLVYELKGKNETSFVEAGHFVFPLNLAYSGVYINKTGSVVDPGTDVPKGANNLLYCLENWVDVSDGDKGMCIIAYDTPLMSLGNEAMYKFRSEYEKSPLVVYFNAFNNSWGTNFCQWMGGDYVFRFRLYPHKGNWKDADLNRIALESVNLPVTGFAPAGMQQPRMLPAQFGFLKEDSHFDIQALKPAEDGAGFVLRLREIKGEAGIAKLSFNLRFQLIQACDLQERLLAHIRQEDADSVTIVTRPFELHSIYLKV